MASAETMPRVVMLTCQFMPDVFGGAEKQCQRVSHELAARGHRVTVLTSTQAARHAGTQVEQGVRVRRIFTLMPPDLLGRWLLFSIYWIAAVIAWGWVNRRQFDVIHCHQGKFGAFVGVLLGRLLRKPVLIKVGNSEPDMDLQCLQRKFLVGSPMARYVLERRPLFVAISKVIAGNLKAFGCRDIIEIPNGIPAPPAARADARPSAPEATPAPALGPAFFYHGRIEDIKRVDVLLEAFALVAAQHPEAALHIIGDGGTLPAAMQLAGSLGLADRVTFHGQVADAVAAVRPFDVFVNASRAEGFSNSLLEALVLGKVLVSTPVSGAAEAIVDGANGWLASDFTPQALAAAMLKACGLLRSPQRGEGARVSQRLVEEKFAMRVVVNQYESLYQRLVGVH